MELRNLVRDYVSRNKELWIIYDIDRGEIELNGEKYKTGELSFNEVGEVVKSVLRELFGDYRTVPYTFSTRKRMRTRSSGQRYSLSEAKEF